MPKKPAPRFVAREPVERPGAPIQDTRARVLELLSNGAVRESEITRRLRLNKYDVHQAIRKLRDEGRIHADNGYWVLGPSKVLLR